MAGEKPVLLTDLSPASAQAIDRLASAGIPFTIVLNESPGHLGPVLVSPTGTFQGIDGVNLYTNNRAKSSRK